MALLPTMGATAPALSVVDGIPTTTSTDLAAYFGKRHDRVLEAIRSLLPQLPESYLPNFQEIETERPSQLNGAPIKSPAYRLTRDGFTLLAMGFTGKRALQFKLAYIDAFNRMERAAHQQPERLPSVDVRARLLEGQSPPHAFSPVLEQAISRRAHALSMEAFELAHEHLRRRAADCYPRGDATGAPPAVLAEVEGVTLGQALAHKALEDLAIAAGCADTLVFAATQARATIRDQVAAITQHTARVAA